MSPDLCWATECERERRAAVAALCSEVAHEIAPALAFLRELTRSKRLTGLEGAVAEEEVARLGSLVAALRRTTGPRQSARVVSLAAVARRAVDRVQSETEGAGEITVDVAEELALNGIEWELELGLVCLLRNAVAAAGTSGACVRARREGEGLIVEVKDGGRGFPPELAEHLFHPLATLSTHGRGTGLPVVARVARDHGADLDVLRHEGSTICRLHFRTRIAEGGTP